MNDIFASSHLLHFKLSILFSNTNIFPSFFIQVKQFFFLHFLFLQIFIQEEIDPQYENS